MQKYLLTLICLLLFVIKTKGNDFATWNNNILILNNGLVTREIVIDKGIICTKILKISGSDINFNSEDSKEFSLIINGKQCDGQSGWDLISFVSASDIRKGSGATVKLRGTKAFNGIEVDITYLLYPDLPVIRKQITLLNNSGKEIMIESLDVERAFAGIQLCGIGCLYQLRAAEAS